jgi:hypothetical protein
MRLRIITLLFLLSCEPASRSATWSGLPPGARVTCDYPSNGGTRVFCIAAGAAYFCVYDRQANHVECAPVRSLGELERP